jgi:hypothetical protein
VPKSISFQIWWPTRVLSLNNEWSVHAIFGSRMQRFGPAKSTVNHANVTYARWSQYLAANCLHKFEWSCFYKQEIDKWLTRELAENLQIRAETNHMYLIKNCHLRCRSWHNHSGRPRQWYLSHDWSRLGTRLNNFE